MWRRDIGSGTTRPGRRGAVRWRASWQGPARFIASWRGLTRPGAAGATGLGVGPVAVDTARLGRCGAVLRW